MLIDPSGQNTRWYNAASSDRRSGYVEQHIVGFNDHIAQTVRLVLVDKGKVLVPKLAVVNIEASNQRHSIRLVGVLAA